MLCCSENEAKKMKVAPSSLFSRALSRGSAIAVAAGIASSIAGCGSSPPPQLYLLSSQAHPPQVATPRQSVDGSPRTSARLQTSDPVSAAVEVFVPEYLDSNKIIVRTDANEVKALDNAQWAENLSVTAARTLAADLGTLLPADDIVPMPSKIDRPVDYRISVDLSKFESDTQGTANIVGRWVINDTRNSQERASARFAFSAPTDTQSNQSIAVGMSNNLLAVSTQIANSLAEIEPTRRR
jgi:uncharacterized protein